MKKIMCRLAVVVIMQLTCVGCIVAANTADPTKMLAQKINELDFIQCKMEVRGISGFKDGENLKMTIDWKENKKGFFYRNLITERNGTRSLQVLTVWNGEHHFKLITGEKKNLFIERKLPNVVNNFNTEEFPLNPYQFLVQTHYQQNTLIPSLFMIRFFENKIDELKSESNDDSRRYSGGICPWTNLPYEMLVFFEKNSASALPRPSKWHKYLPNNKLQCEFVVTSWHNEPELAFFPKEYKKTYFREVSGKTVPTYGYQTEIKDLLINSEPDNAFSVDPAEADYIYDADADQMITIRR
jgi:hypothetical protein